MKKIILFASILFVCSQMVNAQQNTTTCEQHHAPSIKARVERMDSKLNLSDQQEKSLTKIFKKYIDENGTCAGENRAKMHSEIKQILSPEQLKKYETCQQNRQCNHRGGKNCPHHSIQSNNAILKN